MALEGGMVHSILVIDDDKDDFDIVCEAIQEIDPEIKVHYLSSYEDVLKYKEQSFDIVLLDINMPCHDGFYWLKAIRQNGNEKLPVVMYTNSLYPAHIARAYEEGANLYFSKPESFSSLTNGLNKLIHLDWANPLSITETYRQNGKYATFQFE